MNTPMTSFDFWMCVLLAFYTGVMTTVIGVFFVLAYRERTIRAARTPEEG